MFIGLAASVVSDVAVRLRIKSDVTVYLRHYVQKCSTLAIRERQ
jgi:hypothetical protein